MWAQQKGHTLDNFEYLQRVKNNQTAKNKLSELRNVAREIKSTDMAGDKCIYFKPKNASTDGCFARTSVIADYLREKGFKVNYAIVNHPIGLTEYAYHIAACVEIGDENYVVDPMLNCEGRKSGLSKFSDWRDFQKPLDDITWLPKTGIYSGYDSNDNPVENDFIMGFYIQDNQNSMISIPEYAEKWLDNFVKTGEKSYDGF